MAINYIKGEMLEADLIRSTDLSFQTNALYITVSGQIGINNASPSQQLDVTGNTNVSGEITSATATIGGLTLSAGALAAPSTDLVLTSASGQVTFTSDVKFTAVSANIVGPGQKAALTVATTANTNVPYNLTNILPVPRPSSFDGSPASEVPAGIYITTNGLTAFYVEATVQGTATTVKVYQTTLSVAHDMSSAGAITATDVTGGVSTEAAHGITFNSDGTKLYISRYLNAGVDTTVERFSLSPGYDISTANYDTTSLLFTDADTLNFAPTMSNDGAKAYVAGIDTLGTFLYEYTLGVAYDLTSAGAVVNSYDMVADIAHATNYITVSIANDGTSIFAAQYDSTINQIAKYDLGTAYSLGGTITLNTTATPGTAGVVNSMWFKSDGAGSEDGWELYWLDDAGLFYQYDTVTVLGETSASLNFSDSERLITTVDGVDISGQLILPNYTTVNLPVTTISGGMVYDTDAKQVKVHDGTSWTNSGSVVGVDMYVLTASTTDATQTEALTSTSGRLVLPDNTTWRFEANIVARRTDAAGESAGYKFTGVIDRQVGVATTAIVGIVAEVIDAEDDATWFITVDADTTNGSLRIQVTGAAKDISWVAFVRTVEVSN